MSTFIVSCDHVSRTFGTGSRAVVAVHDATCRVERGSRIAVVGPSGSGKSTLIHLLAGLDQPTHGTIQRYEDLSNDEIPRVGVVFQGQSLVPALTAQENVALPLVLDGVPHREAQATALEAMRRVGVHPFASQLPEELSGGQAQRVAVARVLTMRPRLLLADEPTGRLDQESARGVVDVLLGAADELDAALVIATHDPHVSERLTTCWRMRDGGLDVMAEPMVGGLR
jgi:putative ABC transport system ATP-binding protein